MGLRKACGVIAVGVFAAACGRETHPPPPRGDAPDTSIDESDASTDAIGVDSGISNHDATSDSPNEAACQTGCATGTTGSRCVTDADCASRQCVPLGDGLSVCTTSCANDASCVAGWTCNSSDVCACKPAPESCNGLDDDCDGVVDDNLATWCAEGFECTNGACACSLLCNGVCVVSDSDPSNCGGCGVKCAGTCAFGHCAETVASSRSEILSLTANGTTLYWTEVGSTPGVWSAPVTGGAPHAISLGHHSNAVAVDGVKAYFDESSDPTTTFAGTGALWSTPLATSADAQLWMGPADSWIGAILLDSANVYWASEAGVFTSPTKGFSPTPIYTANGSLVPTLLSLHDAQIYWLVDDVVKGAPITGGASRTITTLNFLYTRIPGIAADDTNVYIAIMSYPDPSRIIAVSTVTGVSTEVFEVVNINNFPTSLASDSSGLYWGTYDDGSIWRRAPGGKPERIGTVVAPGPIALDAGHVYCIQNVVAFSSPTQGGDSIVSITK